MAENKECPYVETRLEITTKIKTLEKDMVKVSDDICDIRKRIEIFNEEINEKVERVLDCLNNITSRNGIQDRDINMIMEEIKERKNLNRWTADKVITILTSILSPLLVALLLAFFKAR